MSSLGRKLTFGNDGKITGVEFLSEIVPLRTSLPAAEAEKVIKAFETVEDLIDPELVRIKIAESLEELVNGLTPLQKEYVIILLSAGGWLYNSEVRGILEKRGLGKLGSQSIAGMRAGLRRKTDRYGLETVDEQEWDDEEQENRYRVRPKYRDKLLKLLKPQNI